MPIRTGAYFSIHSTTASEQPYNETARQISSWPRRIESERLLLSILAFLSTRKLGSFSQQGDSDNRVAILQFVKEAGWFKMHEIKNIK